MSFLSDLREQYGATADPTARAASTAPDCEMTLTGLSLRFLACDGLDDTGPVTYSDYESAASDTWTYRD